MPRRTSFGNDEGNEPHRSLRASHQQLNNTGELVSVSSGTAQREATSAASAVAPVSSSSLRQRDVAASGNAATAAPDSSQQRQQQVLDCTSNVTMDTRKRAPSNGDVPSRKKSRSTRISLNNDDKDEESSNDAREQSPNVKLKYPSTITPVCNESTRARMDQQDENASSTAVTNANLLRSNNNDAGDESSTTSTTGSSVLTTDVPVLPEGVVDLYSSDSCKTATCQQHCTATQALTAAFLSTYGHEYYQNLKDQEHHDDASSSSCTSSTASPSHGTTHRSHAVVPAAVKPVLGTGPLVGDLETIPCQPHLTEKMRAILMDWLVELVEEYKLSPQTLHLAVTLVDQSFARGAPTLSSEGSDFFTIQREMLQCVGCACIWIASKIEETAPPCVVDFVYISDNSYTKEQINDMELTVCTALEFRLSQVTPYHFISEFLRAGCGCGDITCCALDNALMRNMVLYLLELSLLPSELAYTSASLKAAAAVYVARVTLGIRSGGGLWNKTLQHYTGYTLADLEETALTIHRYHYAAEDSQLTSCFSKFSKEKYNHVALKTVPLESDLGF